MNSGLVDAHELSAALAAILRENAGPDRLQSYADRRMRELGPLFGPSPGLSVASGAPDWARRLADPMLRALPATAGDLSRLLAQTGVEFEAPEESRD